MSQIPLIYMPILPPQYDHDHHHHPLHYYHHHHPIHYQQRFLLQSYQEEIDRLIAHQEAETQKLRMERERNNNNNTSSNNNTSKNNKNTMMKSIWTSPGDELLKLNTDGCSKGNPGPSSFGGLIRDGKGRWLCGYMGKMEGSSHTSLEAEVWSIFKGLCLIKRKNFSKVLIETDCETILRMSARSLEKDHPLKNVMTAIEKMMIEHRCTIIHTRRDGNHCADQLANLGGKQSHEDTVLLEEPPELLKPYLLRDMENIS